MKYDRFGDIIKWDWMKLYYRMHPDRQRTLWKHEIKSETYRTLILQRQIRAWMYACQTREFHCCWCRFNLFEDIYYVKCNASYKLNEYWLTWSMFMHLYHFLFNTLFAPNNFHELRFGFLIMIFNFHQCKCIYIYVIIF